MTDRPATHRDRGICPICEGTGVEAGWGGCYRCENTGEWRKPATTADALEDLAEARHVAWQDIRTSLPVWLRRWLP